MTLAELVDKQEKVYPIILDANGRICVIKDNKLQLFWGLEAQTNDLVVGMGNVVKLSTGKGVA